MDKHILNDANLVESLIKSLPGLFVLFDRNGTVHWWNKRLEHYSGYSTEQIENKKILELVDEHNRVAIEKKIEETFLKGEGNVEIQIKDKNGAMIPFLLSGAAIQLKGEDFIIATGVDITSKEQERLESIVRQKNRLLGEVHHRVKNNLSVTASLLTLQASKIKDEPTKKLFNESESRIKAMSMVHQMLYEEEEFSEIALSPYIKRLVKHITTIYQGYNADVEMEVDDNMYIDVHIGVPCGLIIHELVSNAFKHGCNERQMCKIKVSLTRDQGMNKLVVSDNGNGLPKSFSPEESPGLGMILIKGLTAQIGGTLDYYQNGGTTFIVTFKTENLSSD